MNKNDEILLHDLYNIIEQGKLDNIIDEESSKMLIEIHENSSEINDQTIDTLLESCKDAVVNSIIGPFGLSRELFKDEDGGSVTTVQNFEKGIFSKNDETNYKMYKSDIAPGSIRQAGKKEIKSLTDKAKKDPKPIIDDYTGKILHKDGRTHIDHVISIDETHKDPSFNLVYSFEEQLKILHNPDNLKFTERSINQSKNSKDLSEWAQKNDKRFDLDMKKVKNISVKANKSVWEQTSKDKIKKYTKEVSKNSVSDGLKLGFREAIGIILKEFVSLVFLEIKQIIKFGLKENDSDNSLFEELKKRFSKIWNTAIDNCKKKYKDIMDAFKDGFISGMSSAIITFLINLVVTTVKRVVRIIREGILSLFRAIKLLLNPPDDMSPDDLYFEVIKLISAAVITSIGVFLEEGLEKFLMTTVLAPIANIIAPILMGILTGISIAVVLFTIDKLNNAMKKNQQAYIQVYSKVGMNYYRIVENANKIFKTKILYDKLDDEFDNLEIFKNINNN